MKRLTFILSIIILTIGCRSSKFNESDQVFIEPIPDEIKRKITIVDFENSKGVIFPKEFQPRFNTERLIHRFTPTKEEILSSEVKINNQYLESDRRFIYNQVYERTNEVYGNQEIDKEKEFETLMQYSKEEAKECMSFDRQYIGFIENGQRILIINFINLYKDTYNLQPNLANKFIIGFGDWFERNTRIKEYNIETKRLNNIGWPNL